MPAGASREVLVLTSSYPRFQGDFAGIFVAESCRYLAERAKVTVLAPNDMQLDPDYSEAALTLRRFPKRRVVGLPASPFYGAGGPENSGRLSTRLALPFHLAPMIAAAAEQARGKTHLLAHWFLPGGLLAAAVLKPGQHLTLVVHGGDWHVLKQLPFGERLARATLRRTNDVVCVADYLREELLALFSGEEKARLAARTRVVAMGLFGAHYAVPRRTFDSTRPLCLLSVGRLVPIKGLPRLLRALAGLRVRWWVVGAGPEFSHLTAMARSLGVHATFFGALPHARLRELYAEADGFALTSTAVNGRVEGTPRVLLEALSAGLPIVASVSGGVGGVLRHDDNALLDAQDEAQLRRNIERLLGDAALRRRLSLAACASARAYDWEFAAPRLFAGVLGEAGRR